MDRIIGFLWGGGAGQGSSYSEPCTSLHLDCFQLSTFLAEAVMLVVNVGVSVQDD